MMHHCFENIDLFSSHFLRICTCSLRSCHYFRFGSRESMSHLLICMFKGCRLSLNFEHTRTWDFTFSWNRCFLQAWCLHSRLLRLNWLFCWPMTPLHMLLKLWLGYEFSPTLLERADQLASSRLICFFLVLFLALADHSDLFTSELEHGLSFLDLMRRFTTYIRWLTRRINQLFCALLLFHIFQSIFLSDLNF